ncbi:MAG: phosphatase PAP2 family protein [Geodermatophilaceae bacterium]|nr:phosphatase PAP2 family protein [Geodermatophilaceae bacterium]
MRPLLIGASVLAAIVAILGVLVDQSVRGLLELDLAVASALRFQGAGSSGVTVLQVLTSPGLSVFRFVVLLPVAVFFALWGRLRVLGFVLLAGLSVGPLTTGLKELVGRVRPTADDPLVAADGLSFPSGHSSGAATLAGVALVILWPLLRPRLRPWVTASLILLALCVAWTRIALGVHYLSDTVGGLALGAAVVLVSMAVFGVYPGGRGRLPEHGWPRLARKTG